MHQTEVFSVWNTLRPKVTTLIRKKISDASEADDIAQEVFIKFWTNNPQVKDREKLQNWLLTVTRNTVADYYRRRSTRVIPEDEKSLVTEEGHTDTDESRKLIPIINSLPNKYRNILFLSEIAGLPHREIARQFDLTVSCVKTRVVRARKLLAERMKECCIFSYDKYGNIIHCVDRQSYLDCLKIENKMTLFDG